MNVSSILKWFLGAGLILMVSATGANSLPPASSATTSAAHRGDPELQKKRLSFIGDAIRLGLISRIEDSGPVTRVLTGRRFDALSFDEKEEIINVVWAYYKTEDPQKNVVLVIEEGSGKQIGEYSPANGGLKMK